MRSKIISSALLLLIICTFNIPDLYSQKYTSVPYLNDFNSGIDVSTINIKFHKETSHFKTQIDLSDQPAAVYLIGLMLEEYKASRRLVVE